MEKFFINLIGFTGFALLVISIIYKATKKERKITIEEFKNKELSMGEKENYKEQLTELEKLMDYMTNMKNKTYAINRLIKDLDAEIHGVKRDLYIELGKQKYKEMENK
jgi:hypothetical protein